ncbi:hypothetical protein Tco_1479435 [Tanacetum coccineum]
MCIILGNAVASQNGASVAIVQTGPSSAGQSVQGDDFGGPSQSQVGATHSGNGGGYKPWGTYIGSPTMATYASPRWSQSFIRNESLGGEVSGSQQLSNVASSKRTKEMIMIERLGSGARYRYESVPYSVDGLSCSKVKQLV